MAIPQNTPSEVHSTSCRRVGLFHRGFLLLCNPANLGSTDVSPCNPTANSIQEKCSSQAGRNASSFAERNMASGAWSDEHAVGPTQYFDRCPSVFNCTGGYVLLENPIT